MPIRATAKKNYYKDSVALMRIAQQVQAGGALDRVSLVMGTPANKEILAEAGLAAPELDAAQPADLMIVLSGPDAAALDAAMAEIGRLLEGERPVAAGGAAAEIAPRSIAMGTERVPGANLCQISVPGPYAGAESLKALKRGLNVFLFSDNVPLEEEIAIKVLARRKGLLVMGPDCGTAILGGVPLGFANSVRRGSIGVVGASGTGMQEVTTRIHAMGEGISHAIGTGSRDVYAEIGGSTLLAGLDLLTRDAATRVIVIVSKPPAPGVAERALAAARACGKPVVVLFLGTHVPSGAVVHGVATLEEAAAAAVALARGARPAATDHPPADLDPSIAFAPGQRFIRGLYSGGTYCTEAQLIWQQAGLATWSNVPVDRKFALPHLAASREHTAIDLGADEFTVGRPHPMIDFSARLARIAAEARDPSVAAIVLDVVLGYGANADPAGLLAPAIHAARAAAANDGRDVVCVAFVCGTEDDPQRLSAQAAKLAAAGATVVASSSAAALLAARLAQRCAAAG